MIKRVKRDRRRHLRVTSVDRRTLTPQEEEAINALEQFLDWVHGKRRRLQIPGHYGNGTFREEKA